MAKDLPYFKFFCSEWSDGDITLETLETQAIFINVCSYYWSNECDVTIEKLNKKFITNKKEIDALFLSNILKQKKDNLVINFLDEQRNDRKQLSKTNSLNAKNRWKVKKVDATALNSQYESDAIKKRREEKRGEENTKEEFLESHSFLNGLKMKYRIKEENFNTYFGLFLEMVQIENYDLQGLRNYFMNWLRSQEKSEYNQPQKKDTGFAKDQITL